MGPPTAQKPEQIVLQCDRAWSRPIAGTQPTGGSALPGTNTAISSKHFVTLSPLTCTLEGPDEINLTQRVCKIIWADLAGAVASILCHSGWVPVGSKCDTLKHLYYKQSRHYFLRRPVFSSLTWRMGVLLSRSRRLCRPQSSMVSAYERLSRDRRHCGL
jgi:hypothetical protein